MPVVITWMSYRYVRWYREFCIDGIRSESDTSRNLSSADGSGIASGEDVVLFQYDLLTQSCP